MYPASTTKIMTALLALEKCNLTDTVTVSNTAIRSISSDYATVYLNAGEVLTVEQLLNILLIPSGNIAGNVLAEHISGSFDSFVTLMNSRAKELGCVNTHFTNSYGLHDDNHYTCAYDLYLIAHEAMKYDAFREIVTKTSYKLEPTNVYSKDDRTFYTTNELIKPNSSKRADNYYYKKAIGIKTGYTSQAKDCLVAAASDDNLELFSVILGADKTSQNLSARYTETKQLFEFGFKNYSMRDVFKANDVCTQIDVKNATSDTKKLDLLVKDDINVLVDKDSLYVSLIPNITVNQDLQAPISAGDVVGHISYSIDGITYQSELLASHDVEKSYLIYIIVGVIVVVLFIGILLLRKSLKNRKKRYKNYRI